MRGGHAGPSDARSAVSASLAAEVLVVGSGFFGLTVAERASTELGASVAILERRPHIGGNAASYWEEESGIEVHKYGSHLFHTSNEVVWEYVNKFTRFNDYRHHVYTVSGGRTYPMPLNLLTMSTFFERSLTPAEARELVQQETDGLNPKQASNLRERAIALVGKSMYEAFIEGYTWKQWQTNPSELPPEIISRLPVRFNLNTRYFDDTYEGLPLDGYQSWINTMAESDLIKIFCGVDFFEIADAVAHHPLVIYTGPIDRFFGYKFGMLTWRTLDFETQVLNTSDFQGTAVMNYADRDVPFTRIHEPKHLHPERDVFGSEKTVIVREFSRFARERDEPYYPVGSRQDKTRLRQYRELERSAPNVVFGGRLGSYQYLDMHMAIASALQTYRNLVEPRIGRLREAGA